MSSDAKRIWTVEDHLEGQPESSIELYWQFVDVLRELGPFTTTVAKTTITFKGSRRGFAGARPTKWGLQGYLDLQRELVDPRIRRASPYTKRLFVNHFRVKSPADIDSDFCLWVKEAYAVGNGEHLL